MSKITKIVITGGPCAGKTSVINALQAEFEGRVLFVPEVATILLSGGWPKPGSTTGWQYNFQTVVNIAQFSVEAECEEEAQLRGIFVLICDRGRLDGAAYSGGTQRFCELYNLNLEEELARYEEVCHLESLATADPEKYGKGGNEHRYETLEQAQALEYATRAAWQNHPRHILVEGNDLNQKIACITSEVRQYLGEF
jgi:thymidylate kinase